MNRCTLGSEVHRSEQNVWTITHAINGRLQEGEYYKILNPQSVRGRLPEGFVFEGF